MALPAPKKSRTAPKFNAGHLDPHRARKLKKEWITTQKLKAKYRAEKRRMGLKKSPEELNGNVGEHNDATKHSSSDTDSPVDNTLVEPGIIPHSPVAAPSHARAKPESSRAAPSKESSKSVTSKRNTKPIPEEDKPEQDGPSLRELAREAYSPASLHTFKSHPLRRRPHGKDARAQANPYPSRTDTNGQKGTASRKRGQPNMAKRMGVLLEKIKRSNQ